MVVGQRGESAISTLKRHIQETENTIIGWKRELEYATEKSNGEYESFCKCMLQIWENTLNDLRVLESESNSAGK